MNEDYLWDRSGEPDPEVQQLEEILGALRYQPRELKIPADLEVGGKRNFFRNLRPAMAIAAAIALLLFGAGLWFGLQRLKSNSPPPIVKNAGGDPSSPVAPQPTPSKVKQLDVNPNYKDTRAGGRHPGSQAFAVNRNKTRNTPQFVMSLQEAEAAREQFFLALRVASTKLNFAQRKSQLTNSKETQNQHRIG
jgi:hypothetical protein